MKRLLILATLICSPAVLAAAPSDMASTEPGLFNVGFRLSLDLREAPVREFFDSFRHFGGAEVEIDPKITGVISIRLDNVTAGTALTAACESVGCVWSQADGVLRFVAVETPVPEETTERQSFAPVTLTLDDADATYAFKAIAELVDAELVLDPKVEGRVTITLEQAELEIAVQEICQQVDCTAGFIVNDESGLRTIEIRSVR